jgi:hypothetical protein
VSYYALTLLEELSDADNIVDEQQLEPDYYIDRPVKILLNLKYIAISNIRTEP